MMPSVSTPDEGQVDAGVVLAARQPDLAELGGQELQGPGDLGPLLVTDHRHDRAVVQGGQADGGEAVQRGHVRYQGGQQQRLDDQVVGAERVPGVGHPGLLLGEAVLLQQGRADAEAVELLGRLELGPELVGERAVGPLGEDVEDRAERHEPAGGQRVAVVDQELLHELERGALALQRAGDVDHRVGERGAERIGEVERLPAPPLPVGVEQDLPGLRGHPGRALERLVQPGPGRLVLKLEQALVDDEVSCG
jgi:hypothetical protein